MRGILFTLTLCTWAVTASAQETRPAPVMVGAIRWDAWYGPRDPVGRAVHASLGPSKWHARLPFFARIVSEDEVHIDGSSQAVMDREIEYAVAAGLNYWAFVTYPAESLLSEGLNRYLASRSRDRIGFCLITECGRWREPAFGRRVEALLTEPGYVTVADGRPLLYLGFISEGTVEHFPGGGDGFRRTLDDLRSRLATRGIPAPYLVIMDHDPQQAFRWMKFLAGDAIGSYATSWESGTQAYAKTVAHTERFWQRSAETGAAVVPTVMTGWDRRPRVERPMFWETWQKPGEGLENYTEAARPAEIAEHLGRAVRWVRQNSPSAAVPLVLIYAWNEFDEGGWLAPTLAEGDARLQAIRRVLTSSAAASQSRPAVP